MIPPVVDQGQRDRWRARLIDAQDFWLECRDTYRPGTPAYQNAERTLEEVAEILREVDRAAERERGWEGRR